MNKYTGRGDKPNKDQRIKVIPDGMCDGWQYSGERGTVKGSNNDYFFEVLLDSGKTVYLNPWQMDKV